MKTESKNTSEQHSLNGLVLAGGRSKRMRQDKSLINYHGVSQVEYCVQILSEFCDQVYVSNRADQNKLLEHKKYSQIHDVFDNIGPLGGILSAMTAYPGKTWLILACDLPFVNTATIGQLIKKRNPVKQATVFSSKRENLPEPLCAVYEPSSCKPLLEYFKNGIHCPRKILMNLEIEMIDQPFNGLLDNINSREEYQNTIKEFKKNECHQ